MEAPKGNERPVVAVVRCRDYSPRETRRAVEEALDMLELEEGFFDLNGEILLKPNLLSRRSPEQAVTTHPAVVEALIGAVRSRNPEARMAIGDSPGGALGRIESFWEKTGFAALSERTGVPLVSFENAASDPVSPSAFPALPSFSLASRAMQAAMIINVPKMKTHSFTYMTCAMKNLYGLIPGLQKAAIHKALPGHAVFCRFIAYLNTLVRPALHVVDAVTAMEGNGPSSGTPRRVGLILAGTDAAALDVVAARLMGISPRSVTYIKEATRTGRAPVSAADILLRGEDIRAAAPPRFRLPATYFLNRFLSGIFIRILAPLLWSRPVVDESLCTRCGKCIASCPVEAMRFSGKGVEIDYRACINCLCCHELCDRDAVGIRFSLLAGKLFDTKAYGKEKKKKE